MKRVFWLISMILSLFMTMCCEDEFSDDCIDPVKIDPDAACIEIYHPVCGCNGITYGNECFAGIAGVTSWSEGTCPE